MCAVAWRAQKKVCVLSGVAGPEGRGVLCASGAGGGGHSLCGVWKGDRLLAVIVHTAMHTLLQPHPLWRSMHPSSPTWEALR